MNSKASTFIVDYFSRSHWLNVIFTRRIFEDIFSAIGKVWLLISVISFSVPDIKPYLSQNPYVLLCTIAIISIWVSRPKLSAKNNFKDSDFHIEIQVGDIFSFRGVYIIGTNTTFDTTFENDIISINSLQGRFSNRYYKNNLSELDKQLDEQLSGLEFKDIGDNRIGKKKRYPLGTTVQLKKSNKIFYLVAIANLNEQGSIETMSFEDIQQSISKLWEKIEVAGNIEPIVIPLLGSSRCRINKSRTDFVKEIINSFVLACKKNKLSEKITIVISPEDYRKYSIDLNYLSEYLNCRCKFPELLSEIGSYES